MRNSEPLRPSFRLAPGPNNVNGLRRTRAARRIATRLIIVVAGAHGNAPLSTRPRADASHMITAMQASVNAPHRSSDLAVANAAIAT